MDWSKQIFVYASILPSPDRSDVITDMGKYRKRDSWKLPDPLVCFSQNAVLSSQGH